MRKFWNAINKRASAKHLFEPITIKTTGVYGWSTSNIINDIGRRLVASTGDIRQLVWIKQRLSLAFQQENAISIWKVPKNPEYVLMVPKDFFDSVSLPSGMSDTIYKTPQHNIANLSRRNVLKICHISSFYSSVTCQWCLMHQTKDLFLLQLRNHNLIMYLPFIICWYIRWSPLSHLDPIFHPNMSTIFWVIRQNIVFAPSLNGEESLLKINNSRIQFRIQIFTKIKTIRRGPHTQPGHQVSSESMHNFLRYRALY